MGFEPGFHLEMKVIVKAYAGITGFHNRLTLLHTGPPDLGRRSTGCSRCKYFPYAVGATMAINTVGDIGVTVMVLIMNISHRSGFTRLIVTHYNLIPVPSRCSVIGRLIEEIDDYTRS